MQFSDVINSSKSWDGRSPYLSENEIFMTSDLTENDLIVRQINASKILNRLLRNTLGKKEIDQSSFDFQTDFYGS